MQAEGGDATGCDNAPNGAGCDSVAARRAPGEHDGLAGGGGRTGAGVLRAATKERGGGCGDAFARIRRGGRQGEVWDLGGLAGGEGMRPAEISRGGVLAPVMIRRRRRARPLRSSVLGSARGRRLVDRSTCGSSEDCLRTAVFHSRSTLHATKMAWRLTKMSLTTEWVLRKRPLRHASTTPFTIYLKFQSSGGHSCGQAREHPVALSICFSIDRTSCVMAWIRARANEDMDGTLF